MPPGSKNRPTIVMSATQCFPDLGGVEAHIEKIGAMIAERGFDVRFVVTDRTGKLPKEDKHGQVAVKRFNSYPRSRDYFFSPGFFFELLRSDYNLLHVQGVHTFTAPMAMLAAALRRRPYVVTFHSGGATNRRRQRLRWLHFRLLGPLLRRANALIAVSEFERGHIAELLGINSSQIRMIRNGGSLPKPDRAVQRSPGLILTIGRLEMYKGHHRAISALPHLLREVSDARLKILGRGPFEGELRALAKELEVEDRVEFGFIDPQDRAGMATALASASMLVLLSDYEAHPVAVMEALAVETPAVVFKTSGLTEMVDADLAIGIDPDADAHEIAIAIAIALRDPLIIDGDALPTWEACAQELAALYDSILGRTSSPRLEMQG
jgi:glycosyltransferase involved in cell wall biosynthesis